MSSVCRIYEAKPKAPSFAVFCSTIRSVSYLSSAAAAALSIQPREMNCTSLRSISQAGHALCEFNKSSHLSAKLCQRVAQPVGAYSTCTNTQSHMMNTGLTKVATVMDETVSQINDGCAVASEWMTIRYSFIQ